MGLGRGPVANEIDLAARGVAAIQSPLWTAQHLDAVQIKQLPLRLDGERKGDPVETHAHGRGIVRGVVDESNSAQPELRLTAAEGRLDLQARSGVLQIVDAGDGFVGETIA